MILHAALALQLFAADAGVVVATRHLPPFAIKSDDGTWSGIAVELWRDAARDAGIEYRIEDAGSLGVMLDGVESGKYGAAIGAITMTGEREARFDFTHPFYSTGLAIAVLPEQRSGWIGVAENLFRWEIMRVVAVLTALVFVVGAVMWAVEKRRNPQFGGGTAEGLGSGFWWSAVTMTTVGYGDKVPVTFVGRLVGLVWMYAAVVLVSLFTAVVTSALTVSQLESRVRGPEDLPRLRVAAVSGTTSEDYMTRHRIAFEGVPDVAAGLEAVARGDADAFVYDAPVLRHLVHTRFEALVVLPRTFERQDYAFVVPEGSPLREQLNRVLVKRIRSDAWHDLLVRYLGEEE